MGEREGDGRSWNSVSQESVVWIDIQDPTPAEVAALAKDYPFHSLNLEDCLSKRQLTKVEDHSEYAFVLLHFPSLAKEKSVTKNQLSIFIGEQYLITLHGSSLGLVSELVQALKVDEGLRASLMKSTSFLAYSIVDKLVDGIYPILDRVRGDLDDLEDEVFDGKVSSSGSISVLRREVADIRRIVFPLRRTLADASVLLSKYSKEDLSLYFADVKEHVEKAWEVVDETRETIEIYKDSDFILSSEKTNKVLSLLTIIFTLSIPATVIASIYGMNVVLPGGLSDTPPTFLGRYTSFIVLLAAMLLPAAAMTWYFRRVGWL